MNVQKRIELLDEKPYKLVCLKSDYSSSFTTEDEAFIAKNKHQRLYPRHKVVITYTVVINR